MALVSTINFLPQVFRTGTNQRFLGATLDHLATDSVDAPINGYIGKTFASTYKLGDNYVPAQTPQRQNYQLEPSVVVTDNNKRVEFNAGYIDLLNSIQHYGGSSVNHNRLFESESYNYDGHFDYDKFVNYFNYYWLPDGPKAITLYAGNVPYQAEYAVTRNTNTGGYNFTGLGPLPNTQLTLARGGTYTLAINQPGHKFWIQTEPGVSGTDANLPTVSTREVYGVLNNGTDSGSITFTVPLRTAQNFFVEMPIISPSPSVGRVLNAAVTFNYTDIQNRLLSDFLAEFPEGLDGVNNQLQNKTFVFINNAQDAEFWTTPAVPSAYTSTPGLSTVYTAGGVISAASRPSIWKINLVPTANNDFIIQLTVDVTLTSLQKVFVGSGKTYASNEFWIDNTLRFQPVPQITATKDYLYYQDESDPTFFGVIKIVDNGITDNTFNARSLVAGYSYIIQTIGTTDFTTIGASSNTVGLTFVATGPGTGTGTVTTTSANTLIDVNADIIGKTSYTSPNGVIFTNGLKVSFDTGVTPNTYANREFYVEGVGTGITLIPVDQLTVVESYAAEINTTPDYLTINRGSVDRNPWTRYNRWFHKDVINAVAAYYDTPADFGPNLPGRRSIIEFEANLQLFNYGRRAKDTITLITGINSSDPAIDAFVDIEGYAKIAGNFIVGKTYVIVTTGTTDFTTIGASDSNPGTIFTATGVGSGTGTANVVVDGVPLQNGDRVIFANDYDTNVRNKIYQVQVQKINLANYTTLVETYDDPILPGETILVTKGNTYRAKTFTYSVDSNGNPAWTECQEKTKVNQAPMFDLIDSAGYSFSDTTIYPNSTFTGTQFFGYAVNPASSVIDPNLGFALTYRNFNNIGDIVFSNFYDSDSFKYISNQKTVTVDCNTGYLIKNVDFTTTKKLNTWVKGTEDTAQYQIFTKFFDGMVITLAADTTAVYPIGSIVAAGSYAYVQIDALPVEQKTVPHTKVYFNNKLLTPGTDYNLIPVGVYYAIQLTAMPAVGDKVDVIIFSNSVSSLGYYEIPRNFDLNPLNETFSSITLGQLRTHYNKLIENTSVSSFGNIPLQDSYLKAQGGTLLQHSAPLVYATTFLNDPLVNFVNGITLAKNEYTKFKHKFLSLSTTMPGLDYTNPSDSVDKILQNINLVKNSSFPWYYSDMVPQGADYITTTYTVLNARQLKYEISSIFDITALSDRAVLVYVNGVQQTLGVDYTFSINSPAIIFTNAFTANDVANKTQIVIRDYPNTDGNYIPETPTKLGLYPKYQPRVYLDTTYQEPINVIQGHDGSIVPAFGDFRDDFLLELEKRIYNNIKADYSKNELNRFDVIPGRFRDTEYSLSEYTQILSQSFLTWVGTNNVDYTSNSQFDANNSWTWNYGSFVDRVDQSPLQGSWRAVYRYWFDTETPNLTPWEMLGFSSQPSWWTDRYGPAPYTSGNAVLWEDLEAGYVWNNNNPYYDKRFARPALATFVPVDSLGDVLSPAEIPLIGQYNTTTASSSWAIGQVGPAEAAWYRSSDYAFGVQVALALTKPAKYFATQLDTSRFRRNSDLAQILNTSNKKISPLLLAINGDTTLGTPQRTSGYINWIGDVIKNFGIDPVAKITEYFKNLSVQLNYKVAGFTDKNLITVFAEQTSPGSTNASVVVPDSNYNIYLNKSVPVNTVVYSGVIVEKTLSGYSVSGYDTTHPFFNIIPSVANNKNETLTLNGTIVKLYTNDTGEVQTIPYGTQFNTVQQVVDFLISYQRYLVSQGFVFTQFDTDLNQIRDWKLSIQEFVYWSQQGWGEGTIIVLNPIAGHLVLHSVNAVVDEVTNTATGSKVLDQNFTPIKNNNFNVVRTENIFDGNNFTIATINNASICYARLLLVQYEHTLIFDNVSDFGDIIYVPSQGTRQNRLKITGAKTGAWTGALSAPGYIYNSPKFDSWISGKDYRTGDIVTYNNFYYTATNNITAATTFDATKWTQIQSKDIKTGLLPSFGLNAQNFDHIYDIDSPPDSESLQLFSAGLIGFRQRQYLTDLGIGIPTQTKFYQGYIKEKGSLNSINALTKANFNNVNGNISVFEEWAFKVGTYGGVNSNTYKEFILDQSVFPNNPVAFTLTNNYSAGNIIANLGINSNLTLSNVYNASDLYSTSTALYNNRVENSYIHDLPSVGYVNLNDIDYTVFDMNTFNGSLDVKIGDKIWTAKDSKHNWNVFRVTETRLHTISLDYLLDSYAQITFNHPHNFSVGDALVLKYLDARWDGIYDVIDTPTNLTVNILIKNNIKDLIRAGSITGNGVIYSLLSAKTDSITDIIANDIPLQGWKNNDRIWVNNATTEGWGVYTYTRPWLSNASSTIASGISNSNFGSAIRVSSDVSYVYTGGQGVVFANALSTGSNVVIANVDAGFGSTIESQANIVVVGSNSNVHIYRNDSGTITPIQTTAFANVTSISMSADAKWLYVGGNNTVKTYTTTNAAWANVYYTLVDTKSSATSFGTVVKTNADGTKLFVSTPQANVTVGAQTYVQNGNVSVYVRSANVVSANTTLNSITNNQTALFGASLDIDSTGANVFVGVPGSLQSGYANGLVERFVSNGIGYTHHSNIAHPRNEVGAFGTSISVTGDSRVLAIGSQGSASEEETSFDNNLTVIDAGSTQFVDYITNSGAVYMFESLFDLSNPASIGEYEFIQDLEIQTFKGDNLGTSVDATRGLIAVGAPGHASNAGIAYLVPNNNQTLAWNLTRQQQPAVDINSISRTFIYNKANNNILAALDFIDPAKGKVLNTVGRDIDYQRVSDPALYNAGTGKIELDLHWGPREVGKIWWNLDTVRYINYEQDEPIYRLIHWGKTFPGSTINVYEWVESAVLPSQYVKNGGSGIPVNADDSAYSTYGYVDNTGAVKLKYYFWVYNKDQVNDKAGKFNSVISITSAIENPSSQGVPYATILRDDTIALYNINNALVGKNSVLHLGKQNAQTSLIHSEYALVQENNPSSQIPVAILNKLVDSLSGLVVLDHYEGSTFVKQTALVPDSALTPAQAYGISGAIVGSPRQTMLINRSAALTNYFDIVNKKLLAYPVAQRKVLTTLNSSEVAPVGDSNTYDITVETIDDLGYLNVNSLSVGYRVLVNNDSTYSGKWSIYELTLVEGAKTFLVDPNYIQSFKTNLYWSYADWYASNFDPTTTINTTVNTQLDLGKIKLVADTYVKVLDAGKGNFAIYYVDASLSLSLVGVENGTIQINSAKPGATIPAGLFIPGVSYIIKSVGTTDFTQIGSLDNNVGTTFVATAVGTGSGSATTIIDIPGRELRQILLAMQNEIFIDDLATDFNEIFFAMIKYILSEQKNLDWVFKTSFISAKQNIRKLEQFPAYIPDNQGFYLNYINEVKPYRTVVREFVVDYQKNDTFSGDITDFDLPAYWDAAMGVYRSPSGEQSYDAALLNTTAYSNWKNNYSYKIVDFIVERNARTDTPFNTPPQIVITGGGGTGANAQARLFANGFIANIEVISSGIGYTSQPTVTVNGTGVASARAVLRNVFDNNNAGHNVIRSISTKIKFDRTVYKGFDANISATLGLTSNLVFQNWSTVTSGQVIAANAIINVDNVLYKLQYPSDKSNIGNVGNLQGISYTVTSDLSLPPIKNLISTANLKTAIDRITAFNGNVDYSLLGGGVTYPGVTIDGNTYTKWTANLVLPVDSLVTNNRAVYITTGNVFDAGGTFANISSNVSLVDPNSTSTVGYLTDSIIQSFYGDTSLGIRPGDINIDGGAYVDTYESHAPEELIPSRVFDSVNIQVFSNVNPGTNDYAFRIFTNMSGNVTYTRISAANTTVLSSNLAVTDSNIYVANSSVLPMPNTDLNLPGVVFIGGEKIVYYTNDTVNNVLGQIRRAVDGTGAPLLHSANTRVVDSSIQQVVPDSTGHIWYGNAIAYFNDGTGLINSTTAQAQFLKAQPGYTP